MKNTIFAALTISALGLGLAGCSASVGVTPGNANTNKPAANTNANAKPAVPASNSNANTAEKPKAALKNEKKPEGTAKTASKSNPVPANWVYVYDENKGYGFSMPEGSTGEVETIEGMDVMSASTPAPGDVDVFVLSYKDKTLTKEDLLKDAVDFLEGLGQKVTPGALKAESDDYAVVDATTVHPTRGKGKLRILVGTDVTDNYVMIIGADEAKFAPNEKTIDEIWGSFEMWSGGASNN